ncbi:MAG: CAP domain-containing protein [Chloroflexi bacterium]|nr:CAP domain-containing protein [Chloroflexota bacterium]
MPRVLLPCVAAALVFAVPTSAAAAPDRAVYEASVIALINQQRATAGVAALSEAQELDTAAERYASVLASGTCFEHTCGPVPQLSDRVDQAGYSGWQAVGENIAAGFQTPEAVVAGWMASPGHRANILSTDYSEVGAGFTSSGGKFGMYWAAEFGTRDGQ